MQGRIRVQHALEMLVGFFRHLQEAWSIRHAAHKTSKEHAEKFKDDKSVSQNTHSPTQALVVACTNTHQPTIIRGRDAS